MSTLTSLIILALSVLVCLLLSLLVKLKKQAQSQSQAQTTEPAPAVTGPSVTLIANVGGIFSIIKGNQMTNATVNNTINLLTPELDAARARLVADLDTLATPEPLTIEGRAEPAEPAGGGALARAVKAPDRWE